MVLFWMSMSEKYLTSNIFPGSSQINPKNSNPNFFVLKLAVSLRIRFYVYYFNNNVSKIQKKYFELSWNILKHLSDRKMLSSDWIFRFTICKSYSSFIYFCNSTLISFFVSFSHSGMMHQTKLLFIYLFICLSFRTAIAH